jgi:hypothetical protein
MWLTVLLTRATALWFAALPELRRHITISQQSEQPRILHKRCLTQVHECPQKTTHPWDDCVYKHPMENARRRNPARFRYQPEACLDYKNTGYCQLVCSVFWCVHGLTIRVACCMCETFSLSRGLAYFICKS